MTELEELKKELKQIRSIFEDTHRTKHNRDAAKVRMNELETRIKALRESK